MPDPDARASTGSQRQGAIRVLLLEDSPSDARLVREALPSSRDTQFILTHETRLDGVLTRLAEGTYDVVITDLSVPDSHGIETVAALQQHAGQLSLDLSDVDVADLLATLTAEAQRLAAAAGLGLTCTAHPSLPRLHTDPGKLRVALRQIITNALKFTRAGGVTIEAAPADGGVALVVTDTGIGIPSEVLPIIFEPFRQGDGSLSRRYAGARLGLYVVRRLVEILGGSIAVDSIVDRGSSFRIWMPLRTPAAAAAPAPRVSPKENRAA